VLCTWLPAAGVSSLLRTCRAQAQRVRRHDNLPSQLPDCWSTNRQTSVSPLLSPYTPGMVHTRYNFKVHASALGGALARLGAALSCPLLAAESAAREVENVHAEYRCVCMSARCCCAGKTTA
jgi:hypothetical protein